MTRRAFTILLTLALGACAGAAAPTPKDTFWRLEAAPPATRFATPPLPGVLEVDRLESDGVLSERALAYRSAGTGVQRYRYDFWSEAPGLLIQDRLIEELRAAGAADKVVPPGLRLPPDWALRGKIKHFEQIPDANKVAVEIELAVVGARDGGLVLLQDYAVERDTRGNEPQAAVEAIAHGVSQVVARFIADLGAAKLPPPRR
ncbi:MAG: membrane integrity-associated transporter subunit PqiC [Magnetospirillum sp.]|nr:membrane integrity-associated transporter subunit PqiC [Magnetospirillum sp.]